MLYERILKEYPLLKNKIRTLQQKIELLPEGKIICTKNGKYNKWYKSNQGELIYIPKKDKHYAEQLAVKKYFSYKLEDLLHEQKAMESYLKHYTNYSEKAEKLLIEESEFQKLLIPYFQSKNEELSQWLNAPYERNPNHQENLIHKTVSGNFVRSKSEAMIDLFLYTNKIPFRYECALPLGETIYYPDFTIRHPQTGKFYYWEHLGKMDDPVYYKKACSKILHYTQCGIIPSIQLIITSETKDIPLTSDVIERTIAHYFL